MTTIRCCTCRYSFGHGFALYRSLIKQGPLIQQSEPLLLQAPSMLIEDAHHHYNVFVDQVHPRGVRWVRDRALARANPKYQIFGSGEIVVSDKNFNILGNWKVPY